MSRWGRWGRPTHVQLSVVLGRAWSSCVTKNKSIAYYSCSTSFSNPLTWHTQLPELHSHLHKDMYTSTLWCFLLCFQLQHHVEHTFTPTPTPSPIYLHLLGVRHFKYTGEVLILRASPPLHWQTEHPLFIKSCSKIAQMLLLSPVHLQWSFSPLYKLFSTMDLDSG